jgi:copper resistance protein B
MKVWVIVLMLTFIPAAGLTADNASTDSDEKEFPADYQEVDTDPKAGQEIQKYAGDDQQGAQKNFGLQFVHDNEIFAVFMGDRLEFQSREGNEALLWDVQAWVGADYNKLWFKSEGTWLIDPDEFEEAQAELLYSRNIATFWDLQVGVRHDFEPSPDRTFLALGVQGLARYWFEMEATAYLSEDGDFSAGFEAEYDLLLSQRLILQPRFETSVALQEVERYGVGQGINEIELGVRLRYEIRRQFAPYIGVSWSRKLGETADLAQDKGEDMGVISFVAGLRVWF